MVPRVPDSKASASKLFQQHLGSAKTGKSLLIVDNVDSNDMLSSIHGLVNSLLGSEHGLTLFTSRNYEIAESLAGNDILEVEKMPEQEALTFIRKSLAGTHITWDKANTAELLANLDYFQLAIVQAVAYIKKNRISLSEYLQLLSGTEDDIIFLMSRDFNHVTRYSGSKNAIATTWVISFKEIQRRDPEAPDLLAFMSCIEWKAILRWILPQVQPKARMTDALGTICSYSFAIKRDGADIYDMHRLVHLATKLWIDENGSGREARSSAIRNIVDVFPFVIWDNRQIWKSYLPHAIRLWDFRADVKAQVRFALFEKIMSCLENEGRRIEWASFIKAWDDETRHEFPKNGALRLLTQLYLAHAYSNADTNYVKASEILELTLSLNFGNKSLRIRLQEDLGAILNLQGECKKAVQLLEQVVATSKQSLATNDRDLLRRQRRLVEAYRENKQLEKAIKLQMQIISIMEQQFREDDNEFINSKFSLAMIYQAKKDYERGIPLLEHLQAIEGKVYPKQHPAFSYIQYELAIMY
ncbi:MAG: hypothetical protein Q9227_000559 [Pyrenula ochraceoflavens]